VALTSVERALGLDAVLREPPPHNPFCSSI